MDRIPFQEELIMHRFYADPARSSEDLVYLSDEDARHALSVLRLKEGQTVEVFRDGQRYEAEIISAGRDGVCVKPLSLLPSTEASLSVTLFQGLPKSDKMDFIVQKAVELGVSRIVPVIMNRCVVKLNPKDASHKLERWRKIAREAGKQCGRCIIPEITEPCSLSRLPSLSFLPGLNIVPWEESEGTGPLAFSRSHPAPASLGILIGPEGGIDRDEIALLRQAGFIPVTLGKRILRTETAGLAAVASLMALYGEME